MVRYDRHSTLIEHQLPLRMQQASQPLFAGAKRLAIGVQEGSHQLALDHLRDYIGQPPVSNNRASTRARSQTSGTEFRRHTPAPQGTALTRYGVEVGIMHIG